MGRVFDYPKKLEQASIANQEKALLEIIENHSHILIDIVTGQLLNGQDGNGSFLRAYRSQNYAEMKLQLNPAGVTDLKLTGNFWDGFFAMTDKFPIVIDSKDEKRDELVEKYGEAIFWPNQEGKTAFIQFIEYAVKEYYRGVYFTR